MAIIRTMKTGIPIDDVGSRLKDLAEAIKEHGMAIESATSLDVEISNEGTIVKSLKITVHLFQTNEVKNPAENLGNSETVKNLEE